VWFTDINESRILIFDADTNTPIHTIGDDSERLNGPFFVAFNRPGTLAFVTQGVLRRMNIYDTSDYSLIGSVDGGSDLNGIDVTADRLYAYVVAPTAEQVLVVQTSPPFGVVTSIPVGPTAYWVQLTPDGSEAWVTNQNGHITIIDTSSAAVVATIEGACSHPKTLRFTSVHSDDGSAFNTGESEERVFAYMGCVGGSPTGDPDAPGTVVRLDVAARSVDTTYYFTNDSTGVPSPRFLASLPGTDVVYATDYLRNELHKIVDGEYVGSYALPSSCLGPLGVESTPDGSHLFIACFTDFDTLGRGSEVMWNTKTDTPESDYVTGGRLIGVGINRTRQGGFRRSRLPASIAGSSALPGPLKVAR
jgi:DNA-binding beta-propeller fold protein YncE